MPSYGNTYTIDTNGLWLELTNVSNGWSYLNLHNATNQVYAVESASVLASGWNVEMELWPSGEQTNVMPFAIQNLNQPDLFYRVEDWTGVTENGNTTPDWWFWMYFGTTALSDTNLDSQGNTLLSDYQNGLDPNIISFSLSVTNNYVNNMNVPAQANVTAGTPSYFAVLVDDTNFNDAVWNTYTSSNLTVNLGLTEGWYDVWVGLKGFSTNSSISWQWKRLKLDTTPPLLVVTNPILSSGSATVSVPLVQIQGYSPEALSSISYDLSNAVVVLTNQDAGISDEFYSTNTWEFTTNCFECVDVPLTNGLNVITLHATDLAGNATVTNISITLDGSSRTNPPLVKLYWPQDGTLVCNGNFTWRGWVDDPTAMVTAQMVDTNGNTNMFNGIVERNGNFWVEHLPLIGTNILTLTVSDWAGNVAVTNITVYPGAVNLTIEMPADDQLWNQGIAVTGTMDDPDDYSVWVNGVKAALDEEGNWTATNVYLPEGGTALIEARAIPNSDNGGNGTGGSGGGPVSYDNIGNPDPPQDNDAESQVDRPARLYMKSYNPSLNEHLDGTSTRWDAEGNVIDSSAGSWDIGSLLNWDYQNGGSGSDSERQESSGTGAHHIVIDDEYTSIFPANGAGTVAYSVTATDFDDPSQDGFESGTYADTPVLVSEHCELNGNLNANISHFDSSGGYQASQNVTFSRHAQTVYELQTGGKGVGARQNLFVLSASAQSGTLLIQPDWDEAYPWNYAADVPVDPAQIQIMGKNADTNGNVYVVLADNQTLAVTPQIKDKDYYTFTEGQSKYHCYLTAYAEMPNPGGGRHGIVSVTKFFAGHGWWCLSSDAPLEGLYKAGISVASLAFLNDQVGYFPLVSLTSIFIPEPGILENPGGASKINAQRTFEVGFNGLKGGLDFTANLSANPGEYSLYAWPHNCVTTTIQAAAASGVTLPNDTTPQNFGIDLNAMPVNP